MRQAPSRSIQADLVTGVNIRDAIESFILDLNARNLSPKTVETYRESALQLAAYLEEMGMPTDIGTIRREHVQTFLKTLLEKWKPATARNRFLGIQQFFRFLVEEDELTESPMAKLQPPRVAQEPPPILKDEELKALLAVCRGNDLESRRDTALIRVFLDTGARLNEVAGIGYGVNAEHAIDLLEGVAVVVGKGGRPRLLHLGAQTAKAIDRYLRVRGRHPQAHQPWLWLGHRGKLSDSGIAQMIKRRGKQAGLEGLHPHLFRHLFAHDWLHSGGGESDLLALAGWRSRSMLERYGASGATQRALDAHKRLARGDRL